MYVVFVPLQSLFEIIYFYKQKQLSGMIFEVKIALLTLMNAIQTTINFIINNQVEVAELGSLNGIES